MQTQVPRNSPKLFYALHNHTRYDLNFDRSNGVQLSDEYNIIIMCVAYSSCKHDLDGRNTEIMENVVDGLMKVTSY